MRRSAIERLRVRGRSYSDRVSDVDVFDRPVAWRLHAVERLGLGGEDRLAGLAIGAGYPDALEPVRDAIVRVDGTVCDIGADSARRRCGSGPAGRRT